MGARSVPHRVQLWHVLLLLLLLHVHAALLGPAHVLEDQRPRQHVGALDHRLHSEPSHRRRHGLACCSSKGEQTRQQASQKGLRRTEDVR